MTDPQDPPRLIDDELGSERLRKLLRESRGDVATPDEMRRLEGRLVPLIWPPTPPATAPGPGASAGSGTATAATSGAALKAGAVAIAIGLAGGGLWLSKSTSRAPQAEAVAAKPESKGAAPAQPTNANPSPAAPSNEESAPAENPAPAVVPLEPRAASKDRTPPSAESVSESDLLGRAQAALRSDPARALALADEHRRTFPNGVLVQEREVLSIEALERLGRHREAVARADRFLKVFPGSAHRSKVNAIIGR